MINWIVIYGGMVLLILFGVFIIIKDNKKQHASSK